MKLNVLWEVVCGKPLVRINSIEAFAWGGMVFGSSVFLIAAFWDEICRKMLWHHSRGWGYEQILVMAVSGLYVFWGYCVCQEWGE